jgi:hypothetical protein
VPPAASRRGVRPSPAARSRSLAKALPTPMAASNAAALITRTPPGMLASRRAVHVLAGQQRKFVAIRFDSLVEHRQLVAKVSWQRAGASADSQTARNLRGGASEQCDTKQPVAVECVTMDRRMFAGSYAWTDREAAMSRSLPRIRRQAPVAKTLLPPKHPC